MKKKLLSLALALALLAASVPAAPAADTFTPVTGWDMMRTLKLGINIGNTLDAKASWPGAPTGLNTETNWGEIRIAPPLFKTVADKGFDHVRIPVTWEGHIDADYTIDKDWMDRVEQCVQWALDEGLYIILNTHHEDGLYALMDGGDHAKAEKYLTTVWSQIAGRFRGYSERLIFEVMNEPHGDNWSFSPALIDGVNLLNAAALQTIRKSGGNNERRCVMLPTAGASADRADSYIHPPNDDYILVSIHAYVPWPFCAPANEGGNVAVYTDTGSVDRLFTRLNNLFISKKIPVLLGETAVSDKGNPEERLKWVKHYFGKAAELNIPVTWWSVGETGAAKGEESWALLNRRENRWFSPELVREMFAAYGRMPDERYTAQPVPEPEPEPQPETESESDEEPPNLNTAGAWAYDNIGEAYRRGILPESLQDRYAEGCTRAEFCVLAAALIETLNGKPIASRRVFDDDGGDVSIRKIGGLGIVSGVGGGNFAPNRGISRQEAALILARVAGLGLEKPLKAESGETYADQDAVADWALAAVKLARGEGIMSGKDGNRFDPAGPFTREESITTMLKLWEYYNN